MLLESMNYQEITAQVQQEYKKIFATTLQRVAVEYEKERKKIKIDKARAYRKEYCIKTAGKNNWMLFLGKAPSAPKFTDRFCTNFSAITYYYNKKGLQVFHPQEKDVVLVVYNGHFFKRYNERLHLNLPDTLDAVKHFFKYNSYIQPQIVVKGHHLYAIGVSKDGLLLGDVVNDYSWVMWRTFISRDLLRKDQDEMEIEMIAKLQAEITERMEKDENCDKSKLRNDINTIYALTNNYIH